MKCSIVVVLAALGCGKAADKPAPESKPDKPAIDSACAAKVKVFEPWLAKLEVEKRSYGLDFGYKLQPIDREPAPITHVVDSVELTKTSTNVFDVSEHDHARSALGDHPTPKAIADRIATIHAMKASADEFGAASDDLLRIDVDQQAPWEAVARVVDAATKAGYKQVVFGFTAKPTLAQPPGVPATTGTTQAAKDASDKLDALQKQCKAYDRVALHMPAKNVSPADDAAAHASAVAAALGTCNCSPDPDELRKLMWMDARWHQAVPRIGVTLPLDRAATTTIAVPGKTPWSEAHAKLLAATGAVKLVAN